MITIYSSTCLHKQPACHCKYAASIVTVFCDMNYALHTCKQKQFDGDADGMRYKNYYSTARIQYWSNNSSQWDNMKYILIRSFQSESYYTYTYQIVGACDIIIQGRQGHKKGVQLTIVAHRGRRCLEALCVSAEVRSVDLFARSAENKFPHDVYF